MPANAGIQNILKILDPVVRRDDGKNEFRTFYESINYKPAVKFFARLDLNQICLFVDAH